MAFAKEDITTELVQKLISTQFPQWASLPITPVEPGGWDNKTFKLGDEMSVRLPGSERHFEQVEKEQQWLPILAPQLPLPIPKPLAMGKPAEGYPWSWSVYQWLEGETATVERITDLTQFAVSLAEFLIALENIDSVDGPPPGSHNFFRGACPATYDQETREAVEALRGEIDTEAAEKIWEEALAATWSGSPVWLHGDLVSDNLLDKDGQLAAVIDFGGLGVGDPACDTTIA